jgi:hypothetical protein
MDLSPWNYWNPDRSPRPDTPGILATLERVMAADSTHPGAHHYYIHAVEAIEPERAITVAERLAGLMPGAGHLVHMPSHIYIRVGRYADAVAINEHAAHADETWIRDQRPGPGFYLAAYYPHNYDFLAFAASMLGRNAQTIEAADQNAAAVPRDLWARRDTPSSSTISPSGCKRGCAFPSGTSCSPSRSPRTLYAMPSASGTTPAAAPWRPGVTSRVQPLNSRRSARWRPTPSWHLSGWSTTPRAPCSAWRWRSWPPSWSRPPATTPPR